jgi:hypothetical protein
MVWKACGGWVEAGIPVLQPWFRAQKTGWKRLILRGSIFDALGALCYLGIGQFNANTPQ